MVKMIKATNFDTDNARLRIRSFLFGYGPRMGFIKSAIVYSLLIIFGFIFLFPIIYMLTTSFKSLNDIIDASVRWLPREFTFTNYVQAFNSLNISDVILDSFLLALVPSIGQIVSCSLVGYALQRFNFPLKRLVFVILFVTFILPQQVLLPSTFQLLHQFNMIGSMRAFIIPAFLGQGFRSAILVLIFYQFFKTIPRVLDEAAQIDGAGYYRIFWKIGIRAAAPAFIVAFLLSTVWYWNETYLTNIYMGNAAAIAGDSLSTLLLELQNFAFNFSQMYGQGGASLATGVYSTAHEGIRAAAVIIAILPILIIYFIMQRYFVEGVEKTGITGE